MELTMLARLTRDLPVLLRDPISVERAGAIVKQRLESRPQRFLRLVECFVYRHPGSPYLRLLRAAGCEMGDLQALVRREGVEGALMGLANQGVYLSFDEFKGRQVVVRGSERFCLTEDELDNPRVAAHLRRWTGGTQARGDAG
jgi:hypothetical protein